MTTARLSPAATLLRNSKLFALPAAIPLPAARPSSEPKAFSDTATTPWPVRAAIETPVLSQNRGDWGLKRPLPLKSTTKSGTPVIRIQRGIDTSEHIADFESAADHVLTLQKWQALNLPVGLPLPSTRTTDERYGKSVFTPSFDNIEPVPKFAPRREDHTKVWPDTDPADLDERLPPTLRESNKQAKEAQLIQEEESRRRYPDSATDKPVRQHRQYRWRFGGPWLAGMTGLEFDAYLKQVVQGRRKEFQEKVKAYMITERATARKEKAIAEGLHDAAGASEEDLQQTPSEEEVTEYIRSLRSRESVFGSLIADFLDLPDGPSDRAVTWQNDRDLSASPVYKDVGPPKCHPSAGLSYARRRNFSDNDPTFGPQDQYAPAVGRLLKLKRAASQTPQPMLGVAGFVAASVGSDFGIATKHSYDDFTPKKGGRKTVVIPRWASVTSEGSLEMQVGQPGDWVLEGNTPVLPALRPQGHDSSKLRAAEAMASKRIERMDSRARRTAANLSERRGAFKQTGHDFKRMNEERMAARSETEALVDQMRES